MEAVSKSLVFRPPFSGQALKLPTQHRPRPPVLTVSCADGEKFSGKDAYRRLAAVRKRIRELSTVERKGEAPVNWTEWEDSERFTISNMILKIFLRGITNRSFAVGVLALVALSVPTMVLVVFTVLIEVSGEILKVLCDCVRKLPSEN